MIYCLVTDFSNFKPEVMIAKIVLTSDEIKSSSSSNAQYDFDKSKNRNNCKY